MNKKNNVIKIIIEGNPITKKNSLCLVNVRGRTIPIQSKAYRNYEKYFVSECIEQGVKGLNINERINIQCLYYMKTKRRVDLTNLLSATMDCLVAAEVIEDDNYLIAESNDGSRVNVDSNNPRVEIIITKAKHELLLSEKPTEVRLGA